MTDLHKNLIVTISPTPYDKPLLFAMVPETARFFLGVPVSGVALVGTGGAGAPYSYTVLASFGGTTGEIAPGVELEADGTITGTPMAQGTYNFVAQVEDSGSNVFAHSFSITVEGGLTAVVFQPTTGEETVPYRFEFIVRDLTGTTITSGFSVSVGTLPDGLSIAGGNSNVITGTPTNLAVGLTYVTIHVDTGTATLDIPVVFTIVSVVTATYVEDRDPPSGWGGGAGSWLPSMVRLIEWDAHIVISGGVPPYSITPSPFNPPPAGINVYPALLKVGGKASEPASTVAPYLMSVFITDALQKTYTLQRAVLIVEAQQGRFQPQLGGVDVGPSGPTVVNFEVNTTDTLDVVNDGDTMIVKVPKPGTGGGGNVETVNGVGPDSSGNVEIDVSDGTVTRVNGVGPDTAGHVVIPVGAVDTVNGVHPDTHGNVTLHIPSDGVQTVNSIGPDTHGNVVISRHESPGCAFSNGGLTLTGTLIDEVTIEYGGTIVEAIILANTSGNASILVERATYANFPTMTTLFTATLAAAQKSTTGAISHVVNKGDVLRFTGSGFSGITRCKINLDVKVS